ncbi:MAG: PIN domain-containing protein [Anaerolineae bacterium]
MPESVFWDTSAFVALGNRDDGLHSSAVAVNNELARQNAYILTTDVVLVEVANSFSKVAYRPLAQRIIEALQQSTRMGAATLVHIDEGLWRRGWNLFTKRPDKEWGLTDCISIVVMQERGVARAFTSDHHFEQAGFIRLMQGTTGSR